MNDETPNASPDEAPTFEGILDELEAQVQRLERGDLPLEEALAAFERGTTLAREGGALLEAAEKKVELLLAVDEDGNPTAQPLDPK